MTFKVYQIDGDAHPEAARDAFMYSISGTIMPMKRVAELLANGVYRHVADVEAEHREDVFRILNLWPQDASFTLHAPTHSLSVGDVVVAPDGKRFVCASFGFDEIVEPKTANGYRVVLRGRGDTGFERHDIKPDEFEAWIAGHGWRIVGHNANPRQRPELQGAPIVSGLCGPMWDGDAIRYEDERSNDILSQ